MLFAKLSLRAQLLADRHLVRLDVDQFSAGNKASKLEKWTPAEEAT